MGFLCKGGLISKFQPVGSLSLGLIRGFLLYHTGFPSFFFQNESVILKKKSSYFIEEQTISSYRLRLRLPRCNLIHNDHFCGGLREATKHTAENGG